MNEFAFSNGRPLKGVISAVLAAVKYLVIPTVLITIAISILSGVDAEGIPLESLEGIRTSVIVFSIPVVLMAFFLGFYPRGSYSRMTFGLIYVVFICLWLWFAFQGGEISAGAGELAVGVNYSPLLLLFIFAAALKGVYYLAEVPSFRQEFLEKKGLPPSPTGTETSARKEESGDGTVNGENQTEREEASSHGSELKEGNGES